MHCPKAQGQEEARCGLRLAVASAGTQPHRAHENTVGLQADEPVTNICISRGLLGAPFGFSYTGEMAGSAGPRLGKRKPTRAEEADPHPLSTLPTLSPSSLQAHSDHSL